ncbi:MAG TPA: putative sulfate exporter family transporter [Sunxiuqinia sp.]|nr:putative sulfate exporter family transporter [Sunxiuqinia sp.]
MNIQRIKNSRLFYGLIIALCFVPFVSPAIALLIGLGLSLFGLKNENLTKYTHFVLQAAIVLMGFGMNLSQAIQASKSGFILTAGSVIFTMTAGLLIGRLFKVDKKISLLIASGTAICGGSAIAAIAPVIRAKDHEISFSLIVIFILNAIALFAFPMIGHYFHMSQETFGFWSAIAIHDTSSVVGAGASYGPKALEVATTVKLTRALWIIPLAILLSVTQKEEKKSRVKIPWFILLFVLALLASHFLPAWQPTFAHLSWLGKRGMVIALLLIGANMSINQMKKAGKKSFLLGIILWFLIGTSSFLLLNLHLLTN